MHVARLLHAPYILPLAKALSASATFRVRNYDRSWSCPKRSFAAAQRLERAFMGFLT